MFKVGDNGFFSECDIGIFMKGLDILCIYVVFMDCGIMSEWWYVWNIEFFGGILMLVYWFDLDVVDCSWFEVFYFLFDVEFFVFGMILVQNFKDCFFLLFVGDFWEVFGQV